MAELFSSTPYAALTARERIWAAIREMKTVTVREVADRCDAKADAVRGYFTGLVAAGVLDVIHRGTGGKHSVYTLKRDLGVHAPRVRRDGTFLPDSVRSRLWNAMPIFGIFTASELAMSTTLAESPVSRAEALDYCRWLARAGYLRDLGDEKFRFVPAELAVAGKPAVLVPFPYATHDHQTYNAQVMVDQGAALLVAEKDLPHLDAGGMLINLLLDPGTLRTMSQMAHTCARPDAASKVAQGVLALCRQS